MFNLGVISSIVLPQGNWFDQGGDGVWYTADPEYLFSDVAGTTPAVVGGTVRCMKDRSGNDRHMVSPSVNSDRWPRMRYDSTLGRHYLEFGVTHAQQWVQINETGTGEGGLTWKYFHDGTEWANAIRINIEDQTGTTRNNYVWLTGPIQASATNRGAQLFSLDNDTTQPLSFQVSNGTSRIVTLSADSVYTEGNVFISSLSYEPAAPGSDYNLYVDNSGVADQDPTGSFSSSDATTVLHIGPTGSSGFVNTWRGRFYGGAWIWGSGASAGREGLFDLI